MEWRALVQGRVVAGVSPQTSSQHQHEASHPQPLLVPVLPTRRPGCPSLHSHRSHCSHHQAPQMLLLQREEQK